MGAGGRHLRRRHRGRLHRGGASAQEVLTILERVHLGELTDLHWEGRVERWTSRLARWLLAPLQVLPPLRRAVSGLSLVAHNPLGLFVGFGIYSGRRLAELMEENLPPGIRTSGDLVYDPTAPQTGPEARRRYRLQVVAADITAHSLLVLPQDVARFGYDPDRMSIALALRMSASVPILFKPVRLLNRRTGQTHLIVDGSVLSNYPLWLLDDSAGRQGAWPTLGVAVCGHCCTECLACSPQFHQVNDLGDFLHCLWHNMASPLDRAELSSDHWHRTVFVQPVRATSTSLSLEEGEARRLWRLGAEAAREFMARWCGGEQVQGEGDRDA